LAEGIFDSADAPTVFRFDRADLRRAGRDGSLARRLGSFDDHQHPRRGSRTCSGLTFWWSGDSSATQNGAAPMPSGATTASWRSSPTRECSTAAKAAL
jgi:hypothetical protein